MALCVGLSASAQVGSYDPNFGVGGQWINDQSGNEEYDIYTDASLLNNNMIMVSGYISVNKAGGYGVLNRFLTNGTPDSTFGTNGKITFDFGSNGTTSVFGVHVLPNQKIIMAGSRALQNNVDGYVIRLNTDGSIDNTFNNGQLQVVDAGDADLVRMMKCMGNGKTVVAGRTNASGQTSVFVARVLPDGGMDNTFSDDGVAVISAPNNQDFEFASIVVDDAGNVFYCGNLENHHGLVGKLLPNGTQDLTFGTNGLKEIIYANDCALTDIDLDADGNLVVSGYFNDGIVADGMTIKLTTGGQYDNTFSGNSFADGYTTIFSHDILFSNCLVTPEGYFMMGFYGSKMDAALHNTDGTMNGTMNASGYLELESIDPFYRYINQVIQLDQNRLLMVGSIDAITGQDGIMYALYYKEPTFNSVSENEKQLLGIYPNPAVDEFQINNPTNEKVLSLEIIDMNGHTVLRINQPNAAVSVPESISNGLYHVHLKTANTQEVHKLYVLR